MTTLEEVDKAIDMGLASAENEEDFNSKLYTTGLKAGMKGKPNPFPNDPNCTQGWIDGDGDRELFLIGLPDLNMA